MAMYNKGMFYVDDKCNHRMQKFSPEGEFMAQFGKKGTGEGELIESRGIVVDAITGYVYVSSEHKVSTFSSKGKFITECGQEGPGEAEFNGPCGLALDESTGHLHVCDFPNDRLISYTETHNVIVMSAPVIIDVKCGCIMYNTDYHVQREILWTKKFVD